MLVTTRITYCNIKQEWKCAYKRSIKTRSRNHCCRGKALNITFWVYVCSLSYPGCKFLPHIILSSTSRKLSVLIFFTNFI